jgi:hypothetical protein
MFNQILRPTSVRVVLGTKPRLERRPRELSLNNTQILGICSSPSLASYNDFTTAMN